MANIKHENPDDKMPTWFKKWNENSFEPLVKRVDRLERITIGLMKEIKIINTRINELDRRLTTRLDNLVAKNHLIE